jgi:hypothetical protein
MHALIPDPSLYPHDAFRRALNRVLQDGGPEILLYGSPQGDPGLRAVMAERLGRSGIAVTPDEIVLCHGASQGISLSMRLFAEPGEVVALEEPTYNNALAAAISLGLETAAVPMREDGMDLAALDRTLARPEVKVLYTIPTFHNPLGITTPADAESTAALCVGRRSGRLDHTPSAARRARWYDARQASAHDGPVGGAITLAAAASGQLALGAAVAAESGLKCAPKRRPVPAIPQPFSLDRGAARHRENTPVSLDAHRPDHRSGPGRSTHAVGRQRLDPSSH